MPSFKNGHLKILNRAFFSGRTGGEATTLGEIDGEYSLGGTSEIFTANSAETFFPVSSTFPQTIPPNFSVCGGFKSWEAGGTTY